MRGGFNLAWEERERLGVDHHPAQFREFLAKAVFDLLRDAMDLIDVEVSVEDAGPGVPPEFRHLLFERFSRDWGTSRQQLGTGLGLFITRELARANGATIRHRDADPHGSVFTLTLPAV